VRKELSFGPGHERAFFSTVSKGVTDLFSAPIDGRQVARRHNGALNVVKEPALPTPDGKRVVYRATQLGDTRPELYFSFVHAAIDRRP
jgi:Tol biopolymer transport system component